MGTAYIVLAHNLSLVPGTQMVGPSCLRFLLTKNYLGRKGVVSVYSPTS